MIYAVNHINSHQHIGHHGAKHVLHHSSETQVHEIVSADLVEIAVWQRPQYTGLRLAVKCPLAVFVALYRLDLSAWATIHVLFRIRKLQNAQRRGIVGLVCFLPLISAVIYT